MEEIKRLTERLEELEMMDGKQKKQCYELEKEVESYKRDVDGAVKEKERLEQVNLGYVNK